MEFGTREVTDESSFPGVLAWARVVDWSWVRGVLDSAMVRPSWSKGCGGRWEGCGWERSWDWRRLKKLKSLHLLMTASQPFNLCIITFATFYWNLHFSCLKIIWHGINGSTKEICLLRLIFLLENFGFLSFSILLKMSNNIVKMIAYLSSPMRFSQAVQYNPVVMATLVYKCIYYV